jgi:hypothetical protein
MFGPLRTQPTLRSRRVVVLQQAGRSRPKRTLSRDASEAGCGPFLLRHPVARW